MKKINFYLSSIVLLILVSSCNGYKPIFSSANFNFNIVEHTIEGNRKLGNQIYSQLFRLSKSAKNTENVREIVVLLNVSKDKSATSKDSTGKILEYKITINTKVKVNDYITEDEILKQNFTYSTNYKVQNQYYDTVQLENQTIDSLIDKTYRDLLVNLSENITTK